MFYDVTVEGMQRGTCMLFYLLVTLFSLTNCQWAMARQTQNKLSSKGRTFVRGKALGEEMQTK